MPRYDYLCQDCDRRFEVKATVADYSAGLTPPCPGCGSSRAIRVFSGVTVLGTRAAGPRRGPGGCGPASGPGCCG